ncbi:MAG: hypothetical protein FDZ75_04790, partial [Actinobacteria bacterium]
MTLMAILQDVDKCMRCNGCVIACKREWNMKLPTALDSTVIPQRSVVGPSQRLAIKSQKRVDMGPFVRFTCWHCPSPPCAAGCPYGAIVKEGTGAVSVDVNGLCDPDTCRVKAGYPTNTGPKPCEIECQRGGYPKVGVPYEGTTAPKMNKCTLCTGKAGADTDPNLNAAKSLPTRATAAEIAAVPEKAHEPACVSSCPAKAMKWDTRDNILTYLNDSANGFTLPDGTKGWLGNGSMFWASKKTVLAPPKADPFIEDHIAPMTASMLSGLGGKMLVPTLVVGGLAAIS